MVLIEKTFSAGPDQFLISISADVELVFEQFKQTGWLSTEAGGQLYSDDPTQPLVRIRCASPPRKSDIRRRNAFVMNAKAAQSERAALFEKGLHCVGLWHTHPEPLPRPSDKDVAVMREMVEYALELNSFLHIIVGTSGLWVGASDRDGTVTEFRDISLE